MRKRRWKPCGDTTVWQWIILPGTNAFPATVPFRGLSCAVLWKPCIPMKPLLSVSGGAKWGDRLERLAFNALPATLSEDMWTHQYLQMTNQPECSILPEDHVVFRTNSGESTFSAWNPHFGCCTSISARDGPSWRFLPFKERKRACLTVLVPAGPKRRLEAFRSPAGWNLNILSMEN